MYRIEKYLSLQSAEYEEDVLEVSESRLTFVAGVNEVITGEIRVRSRMRREIHVFFYSSHYRMQCLVGGFIDKDGVFSYRLDTSGLEVGSVEKGELCILSELGEYHIPFTVSVRQPLAETSLGEIRNLFHFTNLARENWKEATELFYSEDFSMLFYGHDRQYYDLYRGLSGYIGNEHNVDEFLVAIHKKKKNTYTVKEEGLLLKGESNRQPECLTIVCNGWGYMHAQVRAKGEFIQLHTTCVNTEDFYENECPVLFSVRRAWLKSGSNIGAIIVDYEGGSIEVPIIVEMPVAVSEKQEEKLQTRKWMAQLMRDYLACVTSKSEREAALKNAEKTIEKIHSRGGRNLFARLCQVHVLLGKGQLNEAKFVLAHIEKTQRYEDMEPLHYGYYLYLCAMAEDAKKFPTETVTHLHTLYESNPKDALLTCIYVRAAENQLDGRDKLLIYEKQYEAGSRNPILYREALSVWEDSPVYLSKLDDFEISVLLFAMRYGLYTHEIEERVIDLVMRKKEMSRYLFRFLGLSFSMYENDDMLQALCTLMIRSGMCAAECFEWYERAVHRQLRITSLYEYYMMSADTKSDILPPRQVLMYFAYHCELNDRRKAYLFSLLVTNRAKIPELFHQYKEAIETFSLQEMEKGMISKHLSVLYRYVLDESEKTVPYDKVQKIAFRHLIEIKRDDIVKVVIVQDKLKNETVYETEKQRAYVDCYTSDYVVILEDIYGNRYCDERDWTDMKLMAVEKLVMNLERQAADGIGFHMYRTHIGGSPEQAGEELFPIYEKLALSPDVDEAYRRQLSNQLLHLYFDKENYDKMLPLLKEYNILSAAIAERAQIVRYLVYLERDDRALQILFDYGFEGVSAKSLTRLIGRELEKDSGYDVKLMALVYYTFRLGKYTQEMLLYLAMYFEGSLKQMRDIWKACADFDVECSVIAERILQAYLFSHGYLSGVEDIFDYYVSHRKRDSVVKFYIQDMAYRYFVKQQLPQEKVFEVFEQMLFDGCEMDIESKGAYLYYMATEKEVYNEKQKVLITDMVNDLISERQYVPFFEKFAQFIPWLAPYTELTFLEYRTTPGSDVTLHYVMEGKNDNYDAVKLEEVCAGYYCHQFVLFFGERIQYYFMEQKRNERKLTQSGYLEKSDMTGEEAESRFGLLNDIIMCQTLGDKRTENELMQKYERKSILTEKLFGEC